MSRLVSRQSSFSDETSEMRKVIPGSRSRRQGDRDGRVSSHACSWWQMRLEMRRVTDVSILRSYYLGTIGGGKGSDGDWTAAEAARTGRKEFQ